MVVILVFAVLSLLLLTFNVPHGLSVLQPTQGASQTQTAIALSATPSPTPLPKPPVLDLNYIRVIVQVDYGALNSGDPATIAKVEQQIRSVSKLQGRRAGLVMAFGGSQNGSNSLGLQAAKDMDNKVLQDLGDQNYVFNGTVYREFFATDKPVGTIELDVYVFKL